MKTSALPETPSPRILKSGVGISMSEEAQKVVVTWVDHLGHIMPMGTKANRSMAIGAAVAALEAAGWMPGEQVAVVRKKK